MTISLDCPQCRTSLRVPDSYAGKRGKCPKCATLVVIPAEEVVDLVAVEPSAALPSAATPRVSTGNPASQPAPQPPLERPTAAPVGSPAPSASGPDVWRQILSGFTGEIPRRRPSFAYRLGLVLTALFMIALPLIYVGLIVLVAVAVVAHLRYDAAILGSVRGRAAAFALLVYLAPIAIGGILILFMIKPLFARSSQTRRTRSLRHESEPVLFALVERICGLVRSATPRRIDVDCRVNASAHFRRGLFSFLGDDLVLTIGLPLLNGLTLTQLAGVLAHEFGHFSQGAGMRLTYVIRAINFWFVRVVHERDSWDEWLSTAHQSLDLRISWVFLVARLFVWLTRKVLWLLMLLGHVVAGYMLRQMEYDADWFEIQLSGSTTFEETSRQMRIMSVAENGAFADLEAFYREGRLVDDLPRLIMANVPQIPGSVKAELERSFSEEQTGWFDSHPADRDRVAQARGIATPGIFTSDLPAAALLSDLPATNRGVTLDFYHAVFGPMVKPSELHSVESLVQRQQREQKTIEHGDRFFLGLASPLRPVQILAAQLAAPTDAARSRSQLETSRSRLAATAADYRIALERLHELDQAMVEARQADALLATSVRPKPDFFRQTYAGGAHVRQLRETLAREAAGLLPALAPFEDAAGCRLHSSLELLFDGDVAEWIADTQRKRARCNELLPLLAFIGQSMPEVLELRTQRSGLLALLAHFKGNEKDEALTRAILSLGEQLTLRLVNLWSRFERFRYPFDHAQGDISLARYLLPQTPSADDLSEAIDAGERFLDGLLSIYRRALSVLTEIATEVENSLGLPPLPQPDPPPESVPSR